MKITILVTGFPPKHMGGTEIATYNMAKILSKRYEVHIITKLDEGLPTCEKIEGFFIHRVRIDKPLSFSIQALLLEKNIKSDIIQAQGLYNGIPAYIIKKLLHRPYVLRGAGSDIYGQWKYKNIALKRIVKNADAVIALTENMKTEIQKIYDRNIFVVPNGIDIDQFNLDKENSRRDLKIQNNDEIILFVGGLREVKGVRYLINAMKIITERNKKTRLLIVGDGRERKFLENLVRQLDIQEFVIFTGNVPNDKIPEYMVASDIFVLPSLSEGFPVSVLEAMGSALPVVTTDVRGLPEIVKQGENGFLVKPENSIDIAEKVLLILGDKKMRERISNNNREKSRKYTWKSVIDRLDDVYKMIINNEKEI